MSRLFKTKAERKKSLWRRVVDLAFTDVRTLSGGLDDESLEQLEERLLSADFGVQATLQLIDRVEGLARQGKLRQPGELAEELRSGVAEILEGADPELRAADEGPTVYLIVGVNGVGKTTSIAKLANLLHQDGRSVMVVAADTYRAGAIEQLGVWADRIGVDFVRGQHGGDPAAVAYDALESALAKGTEVVLVDTAGRLHTNRGLMDELRKVDRVIRRKVEGAPHETLIVLDATVGQNALNQVKAFGAVVDLSGIILAKMDSSARGGVVVALQQEVGLPVKLVGNGEGLEDLETFDPADFLRGVFEHQTNLTRDVGFTPLDQPVQFLKGVGPHRAEALARMGIVTIRDLLYHVPRRYEDASTVQPIGTLEVGVDATAVGRVRTKGVVPTRRGLRVFQAVLQDDTGMITCAWPGQPWLDRKIRQGDQLLVTGPVRFFHGRQVQPREFTILSREDQSDTTLGEGTIFVAYPASEQVPQWILRTIFERNLPKLLDASEAEEYLADEELQRLGLPRLRDALEALHRPPSLSDAERGRRRLAFDELYFLQIAQAQVRWRTALERPGIAFRRSNELIRPLHHSLGFELTGAQSRVLREIVADMTSSRRMSRMLQGDVGAGKTIIALFSMLLAVEGGYQAALMAPTEILAEQHAGKLKALLSDLEVEVGLLSGRMKAAARRELLGRLRTGDLPIVVGTHALIQDDVVFGNLGLVVVDEQHRFGVRQRMALGESETNPDILIMSATPIPRTLAMTLYGDLDLSVIDELPPGRKPIRTRLFYPSKRKQVWRFVEERLEEGHQAFVVYPLVEESEKVELRAATEEFERLSSEEFPGRRLGLVHGQMPSEAKDEVMRSFRDGEVDLLVATSVIEVGIDVPNATVMVIEHAERFGLSQLHQLRGRVGRGSGESHCLLIAEPGEVAAERLAVFVRTQDGFEIAREDLRIRGQGDLFGAQQHGKDAILSFADLMTDGDLLATAQAMAREVVEADPELQLPAHDRVREVFEARYRERLRLFTVG